MNSINCVVIDDEPIARDIVINYISQIPYLNLIGSCKDAFDALEIIKAKNIDLLFLDINMPRLSGISMLRTLKTAPDVIITTAYSEYALEGFELSVTDYLLKPFSFERFVQATEKVIKKRYDPTTNSNITVETDNYIFVKSDKKQMKININQIRFVESLGNYINIYTSNEKVITKQTLTDFEKKLPPNSFIRIHKSYIVACNYIKYLEGNHVSIGEKQLPIGRVFRDNLFKIFNNR
jgi:two-component system, LytTR family, response regulator